MGVIISVPFLFFFIQDLFANALAGNAPLGHFLFLPQYSFLQQRILKSLVLK